jgi:hypothetical protein
MKTLISGLTVLALAAGAAAGDATLDLKVSGVKAFKADKPGAKTCEFTADVTVKNTGSKDIVASKKALEFTLTGPDGKAITSPPLGNDTPDRLADAVLMKPGETKTYTVKFHMNGAAVEPGKAYKLKVAAYDTSAEKKIEFKQP